MIALIRTELTKAALRTRTLVCAGGLAGLPLLITWAIHRRGSRVRERGAGLFALAHLSGILIPAVVLAAMSGFLLVVVAGMIAGDAVAGDAASGNLRYLLIRPVSRLRLLAAKAIVSALLIWSAVLLVVLVGLAAGVAFFGWHGVNVPGVSGFVGLPSTAGFHLAAGTLLVRLAEAAAYVALSYTALLACGTFFSTLTDTPGGAIGATIAVYIAAQILDSITELGRVRYGLPTHYLDAWEPMLTQNRFPHDMVAGVVVQVAYAVFFGVLAAVWFRTKDIRS